MNNSSSRTKPRVAAPQRPLPATPAIRPDRDQMTVPKSLVKDDFCRPYQLLTEHPLRFVKFYSPYTQKEVSSFWRLKDLHVGYKAFHTESFPFISLPDTNRDI